MRLTLYILLFLNCGSIFTQQQIVTTNFMMNDYYYNPAITGSKDVHLANLAYRNQWTGFTDAPVTLMGNFYGSAKNEGRHGYGVSVISDKTGLVQNTGFYINYAYHLRLNDKVKLGFGIKPGYVQYRVKLYDAQLADEGDAILTGNILSANAFDMHSGFNMYSDKFFFMGSIQHLLGDAIQFTSYNENLEKHYTLIGGYNFNLEKKKIVIQPRLMIKYVKPVPTQVVGMLKATYDNKCWAGITYRSNDAAGVCIGYKWNNKVTVGYGFDYSIGEIRQYQSGSHEIMLSFVTTPDRPTIDEEDENLNNSIMDEMQKKMKEDDN